MTHESDVQSLKTQGKYLAGPNANKHKDKSASKWPKKKTLSLLAGKYIGSMRASTLYYTQYTYIHTHTLHTCSKRRY